METREILEYSEKSFGVICLNTMLTQRRSLIASLLWPVLCVKEPKLDFFQPAKHCP